MADVALPVNASASHEEVAESGPPAAPLSFPPPHVGKASRVTAAVYNPATAEEAEVPNVIYEILPNGAPPARAYWIHRKLKKAMFGSVRSCTVLRLRQGSQWTGPQSGGGASWEVTPDEAVVKIMDWKRVNELQGRCMQDPVKEVAAIQFIARDGANPNVIGTLDVLSDEQYLYSFMPFCSKGELFGLVERDGRFTEPVARFWFRQLLNGLYHLQKMGICHGDISLENILVDQMNRAVITDLSMCLRVPFGATDGSIHDVSKGALRRLILPQGRCGKPIYMSPEVFQNNEPFDAFAIDLWACGVVLFIMLVGLPPFEWANLSDPRFRMISRGGLMTMLEQWNRSISEEAVDLLQRMLKPDPSNRLSLMEVMDHPWVINDVEYSPQPPPDEDWRWGYPQRHSMGTIPSAISTSAETRTYITVMKDENHLLAFDVELSDTIVEVKKKIFDLTGVPTDQQEITFHGVLLGDSNHIKDCKIEEGGIIAGIENVLGLRPAPFHSKSSTFPVTINTLIGVGFDIDVRPTDSVLSLKEKIKSIKNISLDEQKLCLEEIELDDWRSLSFYGITSVHSSINPVLKLVLRLRAGASPTSYSCLDPPIESTQPFVFRGHYDEQTVKLIDKKVTATCCKIGAEQLAALVSVTLLSLGNGIAAVATLANMVKGSIVLLGVAHSSGSEVTCTVRLVENTLVALNLESNREASKGHLIFVGKKYELAARGNFFLIQGADDEARECLQGLSDMTPARALEVLEERLQTRVPSPARRISP